MHLVPPRYVLLLLFVAVALLHSTVVQCECEYGLERSDRMINGYRRDSFSDDTNNACKNHDSSGKQSIDRDQENLRMAPETLIGRLTEPKSKRSQNVLGQVMPRRVNPRSASPMQSKSVDVNRLKEEQEIVVRAGLKIVAENAAVKYREHQREHDRQDNIYWNQATTKTQRKEANTKRVLSGSLAEKAWKTNRRIVSVMKGVDPVKWLQPKLEDMPQKGSLNDKGPTRKQVDTAKQALSLVSKLATYGFAKHEKESRVPLAQIADPANGRDKTEIAMCQYFKCMEHATDHLKVNNGIANAVTGVKRIDFHEDDFLRRMEKAFEDKRGGSKSGRI